MADAVSKLYAEIGFKVNEEGLKKAQGILKDLAAQMTAINNATKNAAREYGIFSKDQAKQDLTNAKIATEASKKALYDKRTQIMGIKELERAETKAKKEKAEEERKLAKETKEAEKKQAQEAEKNAKETKERIKGITHSIKEFGTGLKNTFTRLAGTGLTKLLDEVNASFGRSISTRNFMMSTGMNIGDLQKITHSFANVGSSMTQENIMSDLVKMTQGLADISLGQGDVSTYKLLNVAAQRGDISKMVKAIGQSLQGLDNAMSLNMIRRLGGADDWLQFFKSPQRQGGNWTGLSTEQQLGLEEAQTAFVQLRRSFIDLAEQIASVLSPVFRAFADGLRTFYQKLARWIQDGKFEKFSETMAKVIEAFNKWLESITSEDIQNAWDEFSKWLKTKIKTFMEDLDVIGWGMHKLAEILRHLGYGKTKEVTVEPVKNTGNVVKDYNLLGGFAKQQMMYIDNKTINTNINGVEQEKIPETAEGVTREAQTPKFWGNNGMVLNGAFADGWSAGK